MYKSWKKVCWYLQKRRNYSLLFIHSQLVFQFNVRTTYLLWNPKNRQNKLQTISVSSKYLFTYSFLRTLGREIHQFIIFTYIANQCKMSVHKTRKNNGEHQHNKHASNTSYNLPGLVSSVARRLDIWKRSGNIKALYIVPCRFTPRHEQILCFYKYLK